MPGFDKLEAGNSRLGLGLELPPVEQFALKCGKGAFANGVVVAFANWSHRRAYTHFIAAQAEADQGVL